QITDDNWQEVQRVTRAFHEPGRFVPFLGYEWSGITSVGGDHNIYYLGDEGTLHQTAQWLVDDDSTPAGVRYPLARLWETFAGRSDVMAVPHVGGRPGNLALSDPAFCPVIEIHSHHGTFEWFAAEAIRRGLRVGFIAGSDDHTGRPG